MQWVGSKTDDAVTVASLIEHEVRLDWQEAVAVVAAIAEAIEQTGRASVPRRQHIELKPSGSLEFLSIRGQSGHAVSVLAQTLNALLPKERPTQLRLISTTAGPESASYRTVTEFLEALKYFERPGRRNILSEVYERALKTPHARTLQTPPVEDEAETVPTTRRWVRQWQRRLIPVGVAVLILVAGALGLSYVEQRTPGSITGPVESAGAWVAQAWAFVRNAGGEFGESAARDLSTVADRLREIGSDEEDAADAEDDAADAAANPVSRQPSTPASPDVVSDTDSATPAPVTDSSVSTSPAAAAADDAPVGAVGDTSFGEGSGPLVAVGMTHLFDGSDLDVTPPVTLRKQLPTPPQEAPWADRMGIVEAIVSPSGQVERVKLIDPPQSVHEAMILSAIKTWRFRPATRRGEAVRYRHLIPVAIPQ